MTTGTNKRLIIHHRHASRPFHPCITFINWQALNLSIDTEIVTLRHNTGKLEKALEEMTYVYECEHALVVHALRAILYRTLRARGQMFSRRRTGENVHHLLREKVGKTTSGSQCAP